MKNLFNLFGKRKDTSYEREKKMWEETETPEKEKDDFLKTVIIFELLEDD